MTTIKEDTTSEIEESKEPEILVRVKTEAIESESDLSAPFFAFSYNITITNKSSKTIQLINRHWKVFSGGKQIADVKGEGVVGQQPSLRSGDSFEYSSWTVTRDGIGSMYGTFTFHTEDGEFIDVPVPEFELIFKNRSTVH